MLGLSGIVTDEWFIIICIGLIIVCTLMIILVAIVSGFGQEISVLNNEQSFIDGITKDGYTCACSKTVVTPVVTTPVAATTQQTTTPTTTPTVSTATPQTTTK